MIQLELQEDKINRQVHYTYAQAKDIEGTYPLKNNSFVYNRAPDGYLFQLVELDISCSCEAGVNVGIVEMSDGHCYTGWNIWAGVENRETLVRIETDVYFVNFSKSLHSWECKEYTIATRSKKTDAPFKTCCIVWYYLRKMSPLEKYQYAVIQPKGEHIRKAGATTVESTEE